MRIYDDKGLTEREFLEQYRKKQYQKPSLTADIAVFRRDGEELSVLLVRRGGHPFLDCWALPGGFANPDESLPETAARELAEETGVTGLPLRLTGVYSEPGRDPRGWVVSAAYGVLISGSLVAKAGDDAADCGWFRIGGYAPELSLRSASGDTVKPEELAFDHGRILSDAFRMFTGTL